MTTRGKELYPVMLTPFTGANEIDFDSLARLIRWYEQGGATGLFSVCLSSEMFQLSIEERTAIARFTVEQARVPVVACGHVGGRFSRQLDDVRAMAATGVEAVVLISSAFAQEDESDPVLIENLARFLDKIDPALPLGIYECPLPYKRVISDEVMAFILQTERFVFLKDTCCDLERIRRRLRMIGNSSLKLLNAHADTLVEALRSGAHGYSGVQANCSTRLLRRVCDRHDQPDADSEERDLLARVAAFCPENAYPICAKEILHHHGIINSIQTRMTPMEHFVDANRVEAGRLFKVLAEFESRIDPS